MSFVDAGAIFHTGLLTFGSTKEVIKFNTPVSAQYIEIVP
jgi:hypothetical protein